MTKHKLGRHDYVSISAGSVIMIGNPKYDENDPETHASIAVICDEDIVVCMADEYDAIELTAIKKKEN